MPDVMLWVATGDVNGKYERGDVIDAIPYGPHITLGDETLNHPGWVTIVVNLSSTAIDALMAPGVTKRRRFRMLNTPVEIKNPIEAAPNQIHDVRGKGVNWENFISLKAGE